MRLEIVKGSVVFSDCDVIINAANENLKAGSGVCGAIFQAAGHFDLQRECDAIGYCKTGHAVMTNAYHLKAQKIIHAVGPTDGNALSLKNAFKNSLIIADSNGYKTIGMVPIATGIFGFPLDKCAEIAISVILSYMAQSLKVCYMYCYNDTEYKVFLETLAKYNKLT